MGGGGGGGGGGRARIKENKTMQKKWGLKENRDSSAKDKALGNEKLLSKNILCVKVNKLRSHNNFSVK